MIKLIYTDTRFPRFISILYIQFTTSAFWLVQQIFIRCYKYEFLLDRELLKNNPQSLCIVVTGHEPEDAGRDAVVTAVCSEFITRPSGPVLSCCVVVTGAPAETATPHPAQMQKTDDLSFSPVGMKPSQIFLCLCIA